MKEINFLGLGFEVGQERRGLKDSHRYFRQFFPLLQKQEIRLLDQGEILHQGFCGAKVRSQAGMSDFDWQAYQRAYKKIQTLLKLPETLLNWGGDHSVGLATVGAFCSQFPEGYTVWIDAHADLNLPQYSLSGNFHGMPLAVLLNLHNIASDHLPWLQKFLSPEKLIYVGIRDLDPFEKESLSNLGLLAFTASDIQSEGMAAVAQKILDKTAACPLHISFDIDSLDPQVAPATGVPVQQGLTLNDIKTLGRILSLHEDLKSIDIVEVNPELGTTHEVWQTYFAALDFLTALFNKEITRETYISVAPGVDTLHI